MRRNGDPSNLVRHDIAQQHDVPRIDTHTVTGHGILNFVDDRSPSSFDTQDLGNLDDVVGCCVLADNTWGRGSVIDHSSNMDVCLLLTLCRHYLLKAVTFDEQLLVSFLPAMIVALFDVDDCTSDGRNTLLLQ